LGLKIYFASDAHGSDVCWKKFLKVFEHYKVDVGIFGGDLTGKMVIPIVEERGTYCYHLFGRETKLADRGEVDKACEKIARMGYYPYPCSRAEFERLCFDKEAVRMIFEKLIRDRMEGWLQQVYEKFGGRAPIYLSPGNDDSFIVDDVIKNSGVVVACEGELVELPQGYCMATSGWATPTPWKTPRETSEEKLGEILENLISKAKDFKNLVCNFHCPPYNSGLDMAPQIREDLSIKMGIGGIQFAPVGSKSVRKILEKYQPLLGLHGHIHESAGFRRIGKTLCVNPGSEYAEGILRGYIVYLEGKKVAGHWRVSN